MKNEILHSLNTVGICVIEDYFSEEWCQSALSDIEDGLVRFKDKIKSNVSEGTSGDYRLFKMENQYQTAKDFANDSFLLEVASEYYGYSMVSHFVLGGKVEYNPNQITNSGGGWHRDNRAKQIKTIVYLSDVNEKSGPFSFLQGSNNFELPTRDGVGKSTRYDDVVVSEFCRENNIEPFKVIGKRGTLVFVDTSHIHRGLNIQSGSRYTYTNYYFENHPHRIKLSNDKWGGWFI